MLRDRYILQLLALAISQFLDFYRRQKKLHREIFKLSDAFDDSSNFDQLALDSCQSSSEMSSIVTRVLCVCGAFFIRFSFLFVRLRDVIFNLSFWFFCSRKTMERNYKEDQNNELEALESIYCDDIEGMHNRRVFCLIFSLRPNLHTGTLFFSALILLQYWAPTHINSKSKYVPKNTIGRTKTTD